MEIEGGDASVGKGLSDGAGEVTGGGADIEEREVVARGDVVGAKEGTGDGVSAEPAIEEGDFGEVASGFLGGRGVEEFGEDDAMSAGE